MGVDLPNIYKGDLLFLIRFIKYRDKGDKYRLSTKSKYDPDLVVSSESIKVFTNYRAVLRYLRNILKKANDFRYNYIKYDTELTDLYSDLEEIYNATYKDVAKFCCNDEFERLEYYLKYFSSILNNYLKNLTNEYYNIKVSPVYEESLKLLEPEDFDENMWINILACGKEEIDSKNGGND